MENVAPGSYFQFKVVDNRQGRWPGESTSRNCTEDLSVRKRRFLKAKAILQPISLYFKNGEGDLAAEYYKVY